MAKVTRMAGRSKAAETPAAATAPIDQATLDRIGEETQRMGRVDRVFHWDKRQGAQVWAGADDKILTPEQLAADETADAAALVDGLPPGPRNRHHLVQAPTVLVCGHDKTHGKLIINGAGSLLLCMATKNGAACTYNQPVSL